MAIEFRCSQCQRLLRTGGDTVGKQAQCPECGAITTIPAASGTPVAASPVPSQPADSSPPPTGSSEQTPYPSQTVPPWPQQDVWSQDAAKVYAAGRIAMPAMAIILMTVFGIVSQGFFFYRLACFGTDGLRERLIAQNPEFKDLPVEYIGYSITFAVAAVVIQLLLNLIILYGATQMRQLKNRGFAMLAAILALIPCTSPCCCLLSVPLAIWALIVLNDEAVKAAFRR